MSSKGKAAAATAYENLIDCSDEARSSAEFEMASRGGSSGDSGCGGCGGCGREGPGGGGGVCRAVAIAAMLAATLAASGVTGWAFYRLIIAERPCASVTFVLDSAAMSRCDRAGNRDLLCANVSGSEAGSVSLSAGLYDTAIGPWKLDDDDDDCGNWVRAHGNHLTVGRSGLYEMSAQVHVTFARSSDSRLDMAWQVHNSQWIVQNRGVRAGGDGQGLAATGPVHARLSGVRRLRAGQRVSLHLSGALHTIGIEPADTRIVLSML